MSFELAGTVVLAILLVTEDKIIDGCVVLGMTGDLLSSRVAVIFSPFWTCIGGGGRGSVVDDELEAALVVSEEGESTVSELFTMSDCWAFSFSSSHETMVLKLCRIILHRGRFSSWQYSTQISWIPLLEKLQFCSSLSFSSGFSFSCGIRANLDFKLVSTMSHNLYVRFELPTSALHKPLTLVKFFESFTFGRSFPPWLAVQT